MSKSRFVYVTYIRATPEKLWEALTAPEFTRAYWHGVTHETDWRPGSSWALRFADGRKADSGRVLEAVPPRRLVLEWRHELTPALTAEGLSRCEIEIAAEGEACKLTVTHEIGVEPSKFIEAVSGGWPIILSSLKSLLETGKPLKATAG